VATRLLWSRPRAKKVVSRRRLLHALLSGRCPGSANRITAIGASKAPFHQQQFTAPEVRRTLLAQPEIVFFLFGNGVWLKLCHHQILSSSRGLPPSTCRAGERPVPAFSVNRIRAPGCLVRRPFPATSESLPRPTVPPQGSNAPPLPPPEPTMPVIFQTVNDYEISSPKGSYRNCDPRILDGKNASPGAKLEILL